jgi:hypothetical protein
MTACYNDSLLPLRPTTDTACILYRLLQRQPVPIMAATSTAFFNDGLPQRQPDPISLLQSSLLPLRPAINTSCSHYGLLQKQPALITAYYRYSLHTLRSATKTACPHYGLLQVQLVPSSINAAWSPKQPALMNNPGLSNVQYSSPHTIPSSRIQPCSLNTALAPLVLFRIPVRECARTL